MDILEATDRAIVVSLTIEELRMVNSALNEICNGPEAIDDWEFGLRIGSRRDAAIALLKDTGDALRRSPTIGQV